jgi:hypothetical protein
MEDTGLSTHLSELLSRLHDAHKSRRENGRRGRSSEAALVEMRQAARGLYLAISAACEEGKTVVVHSPWDSHPTHKIRTPGALFNEVVLRYSPLPTAPDCTYHCVLTEADRIEVVSY